jgi:hypothetical protein
VQPDAQPPSFALEQDERDAGSHAAGDADGSTVAAQPLAAPTIEERLEADAIDDDRPWRATLYSWTPAERAAELAQSHSILSATASSGASPSPFSRLLARLRRRTGDVGTIARALLEDPTLNHYRYAWTNGYATAMGFIGRPYGTALVRVELAPNALVLRLDPSDGRPFRLFDRDQREVSIRRFTELRSRVAAVYHVRRWGDVRVPFREYVLCNPETIARWSMGTPVVREEVEREQQLVVAVLESIASRRVAPLSTAQRFAEWRSSSRTAAPTIAHRWMRTMATAAPHYELTMANLRALSATLARYDASAVAEH